MCPMCNDPTLTQADVHAALARVIEETGWAIQSVTGGRLYAPLAYTVGLTDFDLPELVVTGLRPDRARALLNEVAEHSLHAQPPRPGDRVQSAAVPCSRLSGLTTPTRTCSPRSRCAGRTSPPCNWCGPMIAGGGRGSEATGAGAEGSRCSGRGARGGRRTDRAEAGRRAGRAGRAEAGRPVEPAGQVSSTGGSGPVAIVR